MTSGMLHKPRNAAASANAPLSQRATGAPRWRRRRHSGAAASPLMWGSCWLSFVHSSDHTVKGMRVCVCAAQGCWWRGSADAALQCGELPLPAPMFEHQPLLTAAFFDRFIAAFRMSLLLAASVPARPAQRTKMGSVCSSPRRAHRPHAAERPSDQPAASQEDGRARTQTAAAAAAGAIFKPGCVFCEIAQGLRDQEKIVAEVPMGMPALGSRACQR